MNAENKEILKDLGIFFILFSAGWYIYSAFRINGINYIEGFWITSIYFILLSGVYLLIFKKELKKYIRKPDTFEIISLIGLYIISFVLFSYFDNSKLVDATKESLPGFIFASFDFRYLLSKSCEILFQQTSILILILLLQKAHQSIKKTTMYLLLIFPPMHLINIFYMPIEYAMILFIGSIFGAIFFPYLILKEKDGFFYTYILHWGFYLVVEIFIYLN